jgi:hypothetical protein
MAKPPNSGALKFFKDPKKLPMAVRAAPTIKTSLNSHIYQAFRLKICIKALPFLSQLAEGVNPPQKMGPGPIFYYLIKGKAKDKIGLEINLLGQGGTK